MMKRRYEETIKHCSVFRRDQNQDDTLRESLYEQCSV
jgi:hypothetical protein